MVAIVTQYYEAILFREIPTYIIQERGEGGGYKALVFTFKPSEAVEVYFKLKYNLC